MKLQRKYKSNGQGIIGFVVLLTAVLMVLNAKAAFERTISAPGKVGNVVALTNALAELNALAAADRKNARIWLEEGTYNLSGIEMYSTHHLRIEACDGGLLAGIGADPEDTILIGGGEAGGRGVLSVADAGNWGRFTVSNLTVTGGWTTGNGGGICADVKGNVDYWGLIVSNNYAAGTASYNGGGGCYCGRAYYCLFEDNSTARRGGGLNVQGSCARFDNDEGQGAWNCKFRNNNATEDGGGVAINGGQCKDCDFFGNKTSAKGGGAYVSVVVYKSYSGKTTNTTHIAGCTFTNSTGAAVYCAVPGAKVSVSNCVAAAGGGDGNVMMACNMVDCTVECNTNRSGIVRNCNMERCILRNNVMSANNGCADMSDAGYCTNVNCLIEFNSYAISTYGSVIQGKELYNCTIIGNDSRGSNYGRTIDNCRLWNCVLSGNKIGSTMRDIRTAKINNGGSFSMWLTNCVFATSDIPVEEIGADGTVTHEGFGGCRQIAAANLKFEDAANGNYTPKTKSPLYNAGLATNWILDLVGGEDLSGNARVFDRGIDIGAYECQLKKPGIMVIVL